MRLATLVPMICAVLSMASCQEATSPVQPSDSGGPIVASKSGTLVVRVVWDGQGVPDKRVEVLEVNLAGKTDGSDYATFDLPAGRYTVRAYDINRGGPPRLYIDTTVNIMAGKEVRIELLDCLPCV